jgi:hypothetical protein
MHHYNEPLFLNLLGEAAKARLVDLEVGQSSHAEGPMRLAVSENQDVTVTSLGYLRNCALAQASDFLRFGEREQLNFEEVSCSLMCLGEEAA